MSDCETIPSRRTLSSFYGGRTLSAEGTKHRPRFCKKTIYCKVINRWVKLIIKVLFPFDLPGCFIGCFIYYPPLPPTKTSHPDITLRQSANSKCAQYRFNKSAPHRIRNIFKGISISRPLWGYLVHPRLGALTTRQCLSKLYFVRRVLILISILYQLITMQRNLNCSKLVQNLPQSLEINYLHILRSFVNTQASIKSFLFRESCQ